MKCQKHGNEQFIRDIQIFDGKNIGFTEWITQIEKVALLTGKPVYLCGFSQIIKQSMQNDFTMPQRDCTG